MKAARALGAAAALVACAAMTARAQQGTPAGGVLVTVSVAPDTVTVGEPFVVRIRVRAPEFAVVRFPPVPDTADAIEAVDPRAMEDAGGANVVDHTAVYRLVAWDVGARTPQFAKVSVSTGGAERTYPVALPAVTVRSLLPQDSAALVPKDARGPLAPPGPLWKVLLLAGVALAAVLVWWLRRWRRARRMAGPARAPDPFVAAAAAFEMLDELQLPACGEPGRHVIAGVDVLRAYLARRVPALRESLTAQELERALPASELPVLLERVSVLLHREEAIRFARGEVSAAEAVALGREAQAIVRDIEAAYEQRLRAIERRRPRGRRR